MRIQADNITKTYGPVTALDELSLEIPSGTTFGVLGTNGAGKTTFFKLLVGHDRPDTGTLSVGGRTVSEAGREIRDRIGYLPERVGFPSGLTGREVLSFHARMRGLPKDGRIAESLDTVGLSASEADRPVSGYSNGMRRRLGLAAAVLPRPPVLVLDEPTAGLDPRGVAEFHDIIDRVRTETDATVVVTSHVLSEVEQLCDHAAILHSGTTVRSGPMSALIDTGTVTAELRPADPSSVDALVDTATEFGTTVVLQGAVSVECSPDDVPALLERVADVAALDDVSVERAGLEGTFHETLEETA